jgi:hypothetical protein
MFGDYYTSRYGANENERVYIDVPPDLSTDITVEIFDPEVFNNRDRRNDPFVNDVVRGADSTTYTLTAPDGSTVVEEKTFGSSKETDNQWNLLTTFNPNAFGAGRYVLTTSTSGKSDNGWVLQVTTSDPILGEPVRLSSDQITYFCGMKIIDLTRLWYVYVPPDATCVQFINFDLNGNGIVEYLEPEGSAWQPGTSSLDGTWNNCDGCGDRPSADQGDVFQNPRSGWWTIRLSNVDAMNQFEVEASYGTEGSPCNGNRLNLFDNIE